MQWQLEAGPRQVRGYLSASCSSYEQHAKLREINFLSLSLQNLSSCALYSDAFNLRCYSMIKERKQSCLIIIYLENS